MKPTIHTRWILTLLRHPQRHLPCVFERLASPVRFLHSEFRAETARERDLRCDRGKSNCLDLMRLERQRWWEYRGFPDVLHLLLQNLMGSAAANGCLLVAFGAEFPRSVYFLDPSCLFLLGGSVMFRYEFYRGVRSSWYTAFERKKNLLIYGAGGAGATLAREVLNNATLKSRLVGFLDDDQRKTGSKLMGVPIFGTGDQAAEVVETLRDRGTHIDEILLAMPTATSRQIREAIEKGKKTGLPCTAVPALSELLSGKLSVGRRLEMSGFSCRKGANRTRYERRCPSRGWPHATGHRRGGFHSEELCFQLSLFEPRKLIAVDRAESELFRLEADLRSKYPDTELVIEAGDIDSRQMDYLIEQHAVNLLPCRSLQTRADDGTSDLRGCPQQCHWNLDSFLRRPHAVEFQILITTDKAVNPTSVMGLTKRVAELIVSAKRAPDISGHTTKFVSVRFSSVSNGSVVTPETNRGRWPCHSDPRGRASVLL